MATFDLGREYPSPTSEIKSKAEKKKSYPTLYISGVKGLDLGMGDVSFTATGKVVSCTKRDGEGDGCEIEIHTITPSGGGKKAPKKDAGESLNDAFSAIEKKKIKQEAYDEGEDVEEEMDEKMMGDDDDE